MKINRRPFSVKRFLKTARFNQLKFLKRSVNPYAVSSVIFPSARIVRVSFISSFPRRSIDDVIFGRRPRDGRAIDVGNVNILHRKLSFSKGKKNFSLKITLTRRREQTR